MFFPLSNNVHTGIATLTVFVPGADRPLTADSTNANWDAMVKGVLSGDDKVIDLFDIASTAARKFQRLGERVTAANGRIFLDGDEIENALTKQIIRFLEDGEDDWEPLVKFFEKVLSNPNEHSREQLYVWLDRHNLTISEQGDMVVYKGCKRGLDGILRSTVSGPAIVDGVEINDYVPNEIGSIIEMQRSQVVHDPSIGCSVGLHVGTANYAQGYARNGGLLEVHVNPRDVVSVPTDCNAQKVRVARYLVVRELDESQYGGYSQSVFRDDYVRSLGDVLGKDTPFEQYDF